MSLEERRIELLGLLDVLAARAAAGVAPNPPTERHRELAEYIRRLS
jgi:hypothetical protein